MVTLIEINKAINDTLKAALVGTAFSAVSLLAEDVSEPILRPSLKVSIDSSSNGKFNALCREKNLSCRIYFFASNMHKYKLENLKMQDLIETAFLDDIKIKDGFFIPIDSVDSEVVDTVLICSIDLYAVELLPETAESAAAELMGTLITNNL